MVGALLVAFAAGAVALFLALKADRKYLPLAGLAAIVGAIALLIGFPDLLLSDIGTTPTIAWIVCLLGLVAALAAMVFNKFKLLILLGMGAAVWGLFRAQPHVSTAFLTFGEDMGEVGDNLWAAMKGFGSAFVDLIKNLVP